MTKPCGLATYLPAESFAEKLAQVCVSTAQTLLTLLEQQVCNTHTVLGSCTDNLALH